MLQLDEFAALSSLGLVAAGSLWCITISNFPRAAPWRRRRREFTEVAESHGLTVDPATCVARGDLEGRPFSAGIQTDTSSKGSVIRLWARLEMADCPDGLIMSEESILSGLARSFGSRDLRTGNAEIDAVYQISGNASLEEVQSFLTPPVRTALLVDVPGSSLPTVADKALTTSKVFMTPLLMRRAFQPLFEGFRLRARALSDPSQVPASGVAWRKLRRFALASFCLWLPLLLLCLAPDLQQCKELWLARGGLLVMLLLTYTVYRGNEVSRVLLQSAYSVLALISAALTLLGLLEIAELIPRTFLRLGEENALGFFAVSILTTLLLWGARHYLKALDLSRDDRRGV